MQPSHHRKIELQSTADLAYLYTNTVALSRQKLDLHFPPSATIANNDGAPDPMKERVRELVDEFITKTYTTAIPSLSINGIDTSSPSNPTHNSTSQSQLETLLSAREYVEYEPYDARLAARVSALYAQLEALTTAVAQMRRDVPRKAAGIVGERLRGVITEDEQEDEDLGREDEGGKEGDGDVKMDYAESSDMAEDELRRVLEKHPEWVLRIPFATEEERKRWMEGEMSEVYADALRRLVRLQGDASASAGSEDDDGDEDGDGSSSLAATVGKVERARQAAEVVEKM